MKAEVISDAGNPERFSRVGRDSPRRRSGAGRHGRRTHEEYPYMRCGELTSHWSSPGTFKAATTHWFLTHQWNIQHLYNLLLAEYNPIHNYDRDETITIDVGENGGRGYNSEVTSTGETSGDSTRTPNLTNTDDTTVKRNVSAFDSAEYQPRDEDVTDATRTESGTDNIESHDETSNNTATDYQEQTVNNRNENHVNHMEGNIGITTTQQMMQEEIALMKGFNLYDTVASMFEDDMMVLVY